jgi:hypothetical protein
VSGDRHGGRRPPPSRIRPWRIPPARPCTHLRAAR